MPERSRDFPETILLGSRGHGLTGDLGIMARFGFSAGEMLPVGSSSRRWLHQSTHSSVANSTACLSRQGPRRWITSVLKQTDDRLGRGIIITVADAADGRLDPGRGKPLGVADRDVLSGFN